MAALILIACTVCAAALAQDVTIAGAPPRSAPAMGAPFYSGAIIPTPKQVVYADTTLAVVDGPGGRWVCHVRFPADEGLAELMARLLHRRVGPYLAQFPTVPPAPPAATGPVLHFALAAEPLADPLSGRAGRQAQLAALRPQGYVLELGPSGAVCIGADRAGVVNGLASVLQLLYVEDDRLVLRCANVVDWPTFAVRYTAEYHLPDQEFLDFMMLYKINGFGACYPGMRWSGLTDGHRRGLSRIGAYIRRYGTANLMVQFHIGGRGGGRVLDSGNPADVQTLLSTIRQTMELAPLQHLMICYDDVTPQLQPEEARRFARPALAHGAVMEQVYRLVKELNPATVVSFCSPYYQGRRHKRWRPDNPALPDILQYMADLKAWPNRDLRLVWTGPVTESRSIVPEDIAQYRSLVGEDRQLCYWDNTWHYHQPLRNFHARYPQDFVAECADGTGYINVNGTQPIGRFFSVTAVDYYWNPEAFDATRAWRQAVTQFMGPGALPAAEAFYKLRGEDYFVFFTRDVDLAALKGVLDQLQAASLTPELPAYCLAVYADMVKQRQAGDK